MLTNSELYDRIATFDIDGGPAKFTFGQKLARENGWTKDQTERVISEYRKYLYLAMVSGHPVSPSDSVDQAWHMHMLYTYSYWERLTKEVLPKPLHHGPSKGGIAETKKFDDWYTRTLDSYSEEFDAEPPTDVWPPVGKQFDGAEHFCRVNTKENWVVSRATMRRILLSSAGILAAGFLVVGCTSVVPLAQTGGIPPISIVLIGGGLLLLVAIGYAMSRNRDPNQKRKGGRSGGTGCSMMGTHTSTTHLGSDGHGNSESGHFGGADGSAGHGAVAGADLGGSMGDAAGGGHDGGGGDSGGSDGGGDGGSGCGSSCGGGGD